MNSVNHSSILHVKNLDFSYPEQRIFTHFSANFPPGVTLIRGGDGCGKSTLLKLIAGALVAQSGYLRVNESDLQQQPADYKAQVFWTDPRSNVLDQLTPPDYFKLQQSCCPAFNDEVLTDMIDGFGLQEHLHKRLFMLSTGSKRKVFLAAAFASGAPVTLLDEPFAALDTFSISFLLGCLEEAAACSDRAWLMADYLAPDDLQLVQTIDLGD